ncbi:DUF3293 domain-containing protein [Mucisphaera calidilacus]|uniref:DUF3293 domain-containing protein n=1 Tax=Mucisphaera calidilacus TaxID=2527982 RepID=A0A518BY67_9BACT|nr:DUF3293 domain-containing protein [Mucisphaera calidilacus]QDU71923.1 hypothetical protein Pan265_17820 [Mucisphaera calidilacus]
MARMSRELLEAYRATSYTAETPAGVITLRVGQTCRAMRRLMGEHGVMTAVYLTAANPGSEVLSDAENAARLAELDASLDRDGFDYYVGRAIADAGDWPDEASRLVLGMTRAEGARLALRMGQHAFLACDRGRDAGGDPGVELVVVHDS